MPSLTTWRWTGSAWWRIPDGASTPPPPNPGTVSATITGPSTGTAGPVGPFSVSLATGSVSTISWSVNGQLVSTSSTITPVLPEGGNTITASGTSTSGATWTATRTVTVSPAPVEPPPGGGTSQIPANQRLTTYHGNLGILSRNQEDHPFSGGWNIDAGMIGAGIGVPAWQTLATDTTKTIQRSAAPVVGGVATYTGRRYTAQGSKTIDAQGGTLVFQRCSFENGPNSQWLLNILGNGLVIFVDCTMQLDAGGGVLSGNAMLIREGATVTTCRSLLTRTSSDFVRMNGSYNSIQDYCYDVRDVAGSHRDWLQLYTGNGGGTPSRLRAFGSRIHDPFGQLPPGSIPLSQGHIFDGAPNSSNPVIEARFEDCALGAASPWFFGGQGHSGHHVIRCRISHYPQDGGATSIYAMPGGPVEWTGNTYWTSGSNWFSKTGQNRQVEAGQTITLSMAQGTAP